MQAVLITIGDEILSGNTVDTNSNFIASQLKQIGVSICQIFTISDEVETIKSVLGQALAMADLVIATGGLGPTRDDRTKKALGEFFDSEIRLDEATFNHLKALLEKRNRAYLLDINRNQAEVLAKAEVFQNDYGTAPCQMIRWQGKWVFFLPGVPYEVKPLMRDKIIPFLQREMNLDCLSSRIVSVVGIPESELARRIEPWELALPSSVSLSYLPVGNRIKLRLTASGRSVQHVEANLEACVEGLRPYVEGHVISWDGNQIQEILRDVLLAKGMSLSVAESCTGGEIAHLITSVAGSSGYFSGGVVAYETEKKTLLLGVKPSTIASCKVVSAEVAEEMCRGCQTLFSTDIAVSTTGVAGPGPDAFCSEVGEVFYTIRIREMEVTNRLFMPHMDREDFIYFTSQRVLQDVVDLLVKNF
ncbi:CinA family nicotinamide mononucleotide deamidase-related protein [Bergeyella sp. RCAD1439]|uniref:CinA family nicotinamide mononucleotide deamidase-related protein n=1 Tax=Bergeyella anatis TaxID=3113737 RepID=UPI002E1701AE|nr:CinA family nicotinamide mononucleotide deamidase-related protein [Bergeyella sp. RCAD1439]